MACLVGGECVAAGHESGVGICTVQYVVYPALARGRREGERGTIELGLVALPLTYCMTWTVVT